MKFVFSAFCPPCSHLVSLFPHRTPLYLACISGHAAIAEALIEAGADPSTPVCFELMIDMFFSNLLRSFDRNWFPIHRATLWSHILVMRVLIKANVDTNIEDEVVFNLLMALFVRSLEAHSSRRKMGPLRGR
jgi:ankyrin repeat protein